MSIIIWFLIVLVISVCIGAILGIISSFMRRSKIQLIESPTLGLYNLSGNDFAAMLDADKKSLGQFFSSVIESTDLVPVCKVLFLYCQVEPNGNIRGSNRSLLKIIQDSGSLIVVFASENLKDNYMATLRNHKYGLANLAMTFNRRGDAFPTFYQQLFTDMKQGTWMIDAWHKLAPPNMEHIEHPDCPEAILVTKVHKIAFK